MDFLKIREKARERSRARAEGPGGEHPAAAGPPAPAAPAAAAAVPSAAPWDRDPVFGPVDSLEGELAARLEGPPPPDEGFTTWRPGSGDPPPRLELDSGAEVPEPGPEDFTVLSGLGARLPEPGLSQAGPSVRARARRPDAGDPLREFFYRADEEAPEVPLGGPPPEAPPENADALAREEYLTFLLGPEEYAVAIERVREVLKAPRITEVPRAPAHVLGVVTVRGEVVAVLDPRRRLGLPGVPPAPEAGRVVIVDAGEGPCGLLVDAVASVVRLRPGTVEQRPQGLGGAGADCLAGIGRHGERLFTVLDLGALLRRAPAPAVRAEERGRRAGP